MEIQGNEAGGTMEATHTAAVPAGFVKEDGAFAEGWVDRLPADLGEARGSFTKFKSVGDLAKSYHGLEQLLGRKAQAVLVPGEKSSPEEVAAFRRAIGVPERVEEYSIRPEQLPAGVEWNDELARPFAEIAHRHHVPPAAMREIAAQHAQLEARRAQMVGELAQGELQRGQKALRDAWGPEYDKQITLATRAAKMAGVDPKARGFSDPDVVRAFARLAGMLSDDHFVKGAEDGLLGGSERARDIMTNPQNPLYGKYQSGEEDAVGLVRELLQRR